MKLWFFSLRMTSNRDGQQQQQQQQQRRRMARHLSDADGAVLDISTPSAHDVPTLSTSSHSPPPLHLPLRTPQWRPDVMKMATLSWPVPGVDAVPTPSLPSSETISFVRGCVPLRPRSTSVPPPPPPSPRAHDDVLTAARCRRRRGPMTGLRTK